MTKYHSPELAEKILEICNSLNTLCKDTRERVVLESVYEMGPNCFFDDMANAEEAKGAIKVLDWILVMVRAQ